MCPDKPLPEVPNVEEDKRDSDQEKDEEIIRQVENIPIQNTVKGNI